jgi:hypothetical protein
MERLIDANGEQIIAEMDYSKLISDINKSEIAVKKAVEKRLKTIEDVIKKIIEVQFPELSGEEPVNFDKIPKPGNESYPNSLRVTKMSIYPRYKDQDISDIELVCFVRYIDEFRYLGPLNPTPISADQLIKNYKVSSNQTVRNNDKHN